MKNFTRFGTLLLRIYKNMKHYFLIGILNSYIFLDCPLRCSYSLSRGAFILAKLSVS